MPTVWVPPHTRGSTGRLRRGIGLGEGSPAHAGIDRRSWSGSRRRRWFPRTRGDRPGPGYLTGATLPVPPHTRGSTWRRRARASATPGSPAHAGIDPKGESRSATPSGFPRTRGDRPYVDAVNPHMLAVPPHTRGSTATAKAWAEGRIGSPAHAGIDRVFVSARSSTEGFPRTRGDRPLKSQIRGTGFSVPPHTRGSTARSPARPNLEFGSPAHAGIDPGGSVGVGVGLGFPRTRGDRPRWPAPLMGSTGVPPHTRGSTLNSQGRGTFRSGSPAHAGIDLVAAFALLTLARFPRTRGDRPRAGSRLFRPRWVPPHTRGSTLMALCDRTPAAGSPAHAGIDPPRIPPHTSLRGFPRTRGDRPLAIGLNPSRSEVPPHTRGSTPPRIAAARARVGSPAHAGIDPSRS